MEIRTYVHNQGLATEKWNVNKRKKKKNKAKVALRIIKHSRKNN